MKIFPKLATVISALLLATTFSMSVLFYVSECRSIRRQVHQQQRTILQNLAHITRESLIANDDLLLVKYTRWLRSGNPSLISASVVSPRGDILAHSEPDRIGKALAPVPPSSGTDKALVLTEPVRLGNTWVASVSAGFSERQFEQTVRDLSGELRKRIGWVAGGAFALGLAISFILALSWTRPIHELAQAAERIGHSEGRPDLARVNQRCDELGSLSRDMTAMADRLHELDQMKEDFVSAVTHELRSPLGAIESYLNLIHHELLEGASSSGWPEYLERLRVNTQRLTRFVNDLLDVSAIERGKMHVDLQTVDISEIIRDVLTLYGVQLAEKRLDCRLCVPSQPLLVKGDAGKIRQVLMNLVSNAIKFTPETGSIEIAAEDAASGQTVRVSVKDSGIGIAAEDQERIFNKFEQVGSARRDVKGPKGTGLGLAICRSLVALQGGTLVVQSSPGHGSCFAFTLPGASA